MLPEHQLCTSIVCLPVMLGNTGVYQCLQTLAMCVPSQLPFLWQVRVSCGESRLFRPVVVFLLVPVHCVTVQVSVLLVDDVLMKR